MLRKICSNIYQDFWRENLVEFAQGFPWEYFQQKIQNVNIALRKNVIAKNCQITSLSR